jgi:hypothetical protein
VRAIEAKLRPLVEAAGQLVGRRREAKDAANLEAGFLAAIRDDQVRVTAAQEKTAAEEKEEGNQQAASAKRRKEREADASVAEAAAVVLSRRGAAKQLEDYLSSRDVAKRTAAALAASVAWRPIIIADREIAGIEKQIVEAAKGLEGPRAKVAQAGDTLAGVLSRLIAETNVGIERERLAAAEANRVHADAQARREKNAEGANKLSNESGSVGASIDTVEKSRQRLVVDGVMQEGETGVGALSRFAEGIEQANAEKAQGLTAAGTAETTYTHWNEIAGEKQGEAVGLETSKVNQQGKLDEARRERTEICGEAIILEAVGESFDPESPSVVLALNQKAAKSRAEARMIEGRLEAVGADKDSIERHGIAAVDASAERVIAHLRDNGITDAMPFPVWKMRQGADAAALRALASADPARFMGVAVTGTKHILARARELASVAALGLTRPVAVFDGNAPASVAATDTVVFAVERDAAYDGEAAARLFAEATRKAEELGEQLQSERAREDGMGRERRRVEDWVRKWGNGRMRDLLEAIEKTQAALSDARRQETEARVLASAAREEAVIRRGQASKAAERATKLDGFSARVREYSEAEEGLPSLRDRQRQIAILLRTADETDRALGSEITDAIAAERKAALAEGNLRRLRNDLGIELAAIQYRAGEVIDDGSSREVASAAYLEASKTFADLERKEMGSVVARRNEKRDARNLILAAFNRDHGTATEEITSLASEDGLDARRNAANEALSEWERKFVQAETLLDAAGKQEDKLRGKISGDAFGQAAALAEREDMDTLRARLDAATQGAAVEAEAEAFHKAAAAAAKDRNQRLGGRLSMLKTLAGMVKPRPDAVPVPISLEVDDDRLRDQAANLAGRAKETADRVSKAEKATGHLADAAIREASAPRNETLLGVFAREIAALDAEALIETADSLLEGTVQTVRSYETDIRTHEAKEELIVTALINVAKKGIDALNATEGVKVPPSVPRFGGFPILKRRANFSRLGEAQRRDICKAWLETQVRVDRVPLKGHLIVAEIIGKYSEALGGETLGIEILKPTDAGEIGYMPIGETRASGGEGLTASLFLWLVLVRQRAKTKADQRSAIGGVLFLDNPFGTASHQLFLRSQRALAEAMGIQLIFTTGINDLNALGEFPHILKFGKVSTRGTRILVKVAHETIGDPDPPLEEAAE